MMKPTSAPRLESALATIRPGRLDDESIPVAGAPAQTSITASSPPSHWSAPCAHTECTLHQLSPYIGKLKSVIARDLISEYTKPGDLVADMFCGSGTVPLEAACLGRRVFASDIGRYAQVLTKGKLLSPASANVALLELNCLLSRAESVPLPDLQSVPNWVKAFFHPDTLKETLRITAILDDEGRYFFLACLLGILHHERPGFLSFPSSHLVPYLRSRKFPQDVYPELYEYRPVAPRLRAKVSRALKRPPATNLESAIDGIRQSSVESIELPDGIDCVITSPPYMNALDYGRDNRLRLWFLNEVSYESIDRQLSRLQNFMDLMAALARKLNGKVRTGGHCIFVVGEQVDRHGKHFLSERIVDVFVRNTSNYRLCSIIHDRIPDVRRSRKNLTGVKAENILVFRKL